MKFKNIKIKNKIFFYYFIKVIENIKNKNIYKIKYLMKGMKSEMNYEMKNEINVLNIGWLILIFGDSWNLENYKLIFFYYLTKVVEKKMIVCFI